MIPEQSLFRPGTVSIPGEYFNIHLIGYCKEPGLAEEANVVRFHSQVCIDPHGQGVWVTTNGKYTNTDTKQIVLKKGFLLIPWREVLGLHFLADLVGLADQKIKEQEALGRTTGRKPGFQNRTAM